MATITGTKTAEGIFEIITFGASATGLVAGDQTEAVYSGFYESVAFRVSGSIGSTPSIRFQVSPDGVNFSSFSAAATALGVYNAANNSLPVRFPFVGVSATGSASMDIGIQIIGMKPISLFS